MFDPATPGPFTCREAKERARPVARVTTSWYETHSHCSFSGSGKLVERERQGDTHTFECVVFQITYLYINVHILYIVKQDQIIIDLSPEGLHLFLGLQVVHFKLNCVGL